MSKTVKDARGADYSATLFDWVSSQNVSYFRKLDKKTDLPMDGLGPANAVSILTRLTCDTHGNVTFRRSQGDGATTADDRHEYTQYSPYHDSTRSPLARPFRSCAQDHAVGGPPPCSDASWF